MPIVKEIKRATVGEAPTSALTGHGAGVGCGHEADSGDDDGVGFL